MTRKALFFLIIIGIPFLSGCWDVEEISKRGIASAIFIDIGDTKELKLGVVLNIPGTEVPPIVGTTQQFEKRHFVITGEGDSIVEAWTKVQANTVRNIFFGQNRVIIISEELAKDNINDILDFVGRIPLIPPNTNVLVTKEDPEELLKKQNSDNYVPGNYIDFYFRTQHIRSLAIPIDLWRVNSIMDSKSVDPFIPLIESSQNNYLIGGTALFSKNRIVGELSMDETETFSLLKGTDVGYLTLPLEEDNHVAFAFVTSSTKISTSMSPDELLRFNVKVDIRGSIMETYPHREIKWQEKKEIERKAEELTRKNIENLISKLQDLNTDPVGFREKLRIAYPHRWKDIDWDELYPDAKITVKTNFSIKTTGLYR